MPSLQDFFGGRPVSPDTLQPIVQAIEALQDKAARIIWMRRIDGNTNSKDTADGDDVVAMGFTRSIDNKQITAATTDIEIDVVFQVAFARPPVVVGIAHAKKPVMCAVSNVSEAGCTFSLRSVGSIDNAIDITAISYIAIGPKARSN